jgi:hypothetical protein
MIQFPNTGAIQVRLAFPARMILQSETQEELDALSLSPKRSGRKLPCVASGIPSAEGATIGRGV